MTKTNNFEILNNELVKYNGSDESVVIPDGITTIGDFVFSMNENLTNVYIPDSVTTIGKCAFSDCGKLSNINIPDSITSIGNGAFRGCEGLKDENGFVIVNDILFDYYGDEKVVTIPCGIKTISDSAFCDCENLTNIVIPDTVTTIGNGAFYGCQGLQDENGFVIIRDTLYDYFGEEKNITIPDGVKAISEYAFCENYNLISVNIPDSVAYIGVFAFNGCLNLSSVNICNKSVIIDDYAFCCCEGLIDENGFVIVNDILFGYYGDQDIHEILNSDNRPFKECSNYITVTKIKDAFPNFDREAFLGRKTNLKKYNFEKGEKTNNESNC